PSLPLPPRLLARRPPCGTLFPSTSLFRSVIPEAETIPMDQIPDNLNHFNSNDTYYIICKAGGRSAQVVQYLERNGVHAVNVEGRSEEHTSELQSRFDLVCRLLPEKKQHAR